MITAISRYSGCFIWLAFSAPLFALHSLFSLDFKYLQIWQKHWTTCVQKIFFHLHSLVEEVQLQCILWCREFVIYHGYLDVISGLHQDEVTLEKGGKTAENVLKCHSQPCYTSTEATKSSLKTIRHQMTRQGHSHEIFYKGGKTTIQWVC